MINEIRKIVREELGVQMEIKQAAKRMAELTIHHFNQQKPTIPEYEVAEMGFLYKTENQKIIDATQVETVHIQPYIIEQKAPQSNDKKITGSFKTNKTTINNNNLFKIVIVINFKLTTEEYGRLNEFIPLIENVIAHEMNHAFVFIQKYYKKPSKSGIHNSINNKMKYDYFNDIPALKEFMQMFYLALPEEIQARIQETGSILNHIESKNYKETIDELYRYQPINDAKRMLNYRGYALRGVSVNTLNEFVQMFHRHLEQERGTLQFKKINDVEKFFQHWINRINSGGAKLNKKILKLVAQKFNLSEAEEYKKPFETGVWYDIFDYDPFQDDWEFKLL